MPTKKIKIGINDLIIDIRHREVNISFSFFFDILNLGNRYEFFMIRKINDETINNISEYKKYLLAYREEMTLVEQGICNAILEEIAFIENNHFPSLELRVRYVDRWHELKILERLEKLERMQDKIADVSLDNKQTEYMVIQKEFGWSEEKTKETFDDVIWGLWSWIGEKKECIEIMIEESFRNRNMPILNTDSSNKPIPWLKNKTDFYALAEDWLSLGYVPKNELPSLAKHFLFVNEQKNSSSVPTADKIRDGARKIRNKELVASKEYETIIRPHLQNMSG